LLLLVVTTAAVLFAATQVRFMSNVFNPHATLGAIMLLGLFLLALAAFIALALIVPRAAFELYRNPLARTPPHRAVLSAGAVALVLLGTWVIWFWRR
jgi:hypothetical protein